MRMTWYESKLPRMGPHSWEQLAVHAVTRLEGERLRHDFDERSGQGGGLVPFEFFRKQRAWLVGIPHFSTSSTSVFEVDDYSMNTILSWPSSLHVL